MLTRVLQRARWSSRVYCITGGRRELPLGPARLQEQLSALWEVALICFGIFSPTFSSLILSHRDSLPITWNELGKAAPQCRSGWRDSWRQEIRTKIMCSSEACLVADAFGYLSMWLIALFLNFRWGSSNYITTLCKGQSFGSTWPAVLWLAAMFWAQRSQAFVYLVFWHEDWLTEQSSVFFLSPLLVLTAPRLDHHAKSSEEELNTRPHSCFCSSDKEATSTNVYKHITCGRNTTDNAFLPTSVIKIPTRPREKKLLGVGRIQLPKI